MANPAKYTAAVKEGKIDDKKDEKNADIKEEKKAAKKPGNEHPK